MSTEALDGRIGEGWSGDAPNGSHVNVVLAHRGSPTFAAAVSMLAQPSPGHTPVLVCVGETPRDYEPVWPPTLMMNKATATDDRHQTLTWGAAQLGIAQGVLDAVADGVLEATGDLLVLVAVWVDPGASDETAVRDREPRSGPQGDRRLRRRSRSGRGGRARRAARRLREPVLHRSVSR